jgi:hypothetical protein
MSIKINFHGIEVTASSSAEAVELLRKLTEMPAVAFSTTGRTLGRPRKHPLPNGLFDNAPTEEQKLAHALFITLNRIDDPKIEDIMEAVEVNSAKGVGGRLVRINNFLAREGFNPKDVYEYRKNTDGSREWVHGPKLEEALQKIKGGMR